MKKLLIFLLGVGTGSVITWYITKERYRGIANEEIASVVARFKEMEKELNKTKPDQMNPNYKKESNKDVSEPEKSKDININSYKERIEKNGYSNSMGIDTADENDYTVTTEKLPEKIAPYIITEEEFGENGYEEKTLMYCTDGILADESDEIIINPETVIGNTLNDFGEFDEAMYVRDDTNEIDFIILRSEKTYDEIAPREDN